jgi:hypothetical protein
MIVYVPRVRAIDSQNKERSKINKSSGIHKTKRMHMMSCLLPGNNPI